MYNFKGVTIGVGFIVAAGSIVTKSITSNKIGESCQFIKFVNE